MGLCMEAYKVFGCNLDSKSAQFIERAKMQGDELQLLQLKQFVFTNGFMLS